MPTLANQIEDALREIWERASETDVFLDATIKGDDKDEEVDLLDKYARITKELADVKAKIEEIERNRTTTRLALLMDEEG